MSQSSVHSTDKNNKKFGLYKNINAQFLKNMEMRSIRLICIVVVKYRICKGKLLSTEHSIT